VDYHFIMASLSDIGLAKILVKTERAKKHLFDVEQAASEARDNVISFFVDSEGNLVGPEPSRAISIDLVTAAGDMIHNLRSALDHLAWQLAHWERTIPDSMCCFPIAASLSEYESKKIRHVAGMSPEAKKAIDDLRPYKGGNEPLWRIHYLDIVDKHHQPLVLGYRTLFHGVGSLPGLFGTVTDQPAHFLGITAEDPQSKYQGEDERSPQPTSIELQVSHMKPLIPSLHELVVFTEDLIKNFKPLLGQLRP
jgi:hypothetical protein